MKSDNGGSGVEKLLAEDSEIEAGEADRVLRESPWAWWRSQMPITTTWAYFDHAAVAPLPAAAVEAIEKFGQEASQLGDTVWPSWAGNLERLRGQFSSLLNADSSEICLIPNTTTGINLVAEGWPWEPGDSIVLPEGEFPSNLFPWLNQQERGVEIRIVPRRDGRVEISDLLDRVDQSTRLIAVSWVGYASGYRIDVDRLVEQAHRSGVMVFLDAIQGLGMYPLDVQKTPVDFLAADGHKWLLGPEGCGAAMVAKRHLERLRCGNVGWNSVRNPHNYTDPKLELRPAAARFEPGSANMIGAAALSASVAMFLRVREEHGESAIQNRVVGLVEQLDSKLSDAGAVTRMVAHPDHRSGILTFDLPGVEPSEVRRRALEEKVVVSCRGGGVRASVHAYNDDTDLSRLAAVVRQCAT